MGAIQTNSQRIAAIIAGRRAAAAREIKDLINDSVGKVSEGSRLVEDSGGVLGQIVTSVRSLAQLVAGIASASTQQNSALVEQASAGSESILEQARTLRAALTAAGQGGEAADASGAPATSAAGHDRRGSTRPWAGKAAVVAQASHG
jgi:methyl-accepting chemotaxis protein